jgi:hypothetical protein
VRVLKRRPDDGTLRLERCRVAQGPELLSGAVWEDVTFEIRDDMGRAVLWADIRFLADQPEPKPSLN